jgi:predicted nucleotidyltransferase component of viral defense system
LPAKVRAALPRDAARAWQTLAPHLPAALYLGGGAATAVRLGAHRISQDLDFFYHAEAVDLDELEATLEELGFAVSYRAPGTLRGVLGATKVEFFHADEVRPQHLLGPPDETAGLRVAGLKDLMAMKLKVLAERGELRDYYDVMRIEQQGGLSVEDGVALYLERYGLDPRGDALPHLVRALGYLDDADQDGSIPTTKAELARWWRRRQVELIRNLGQ